MLVAVARDRVGINVMIASRDQSTELSSYHSYHLSLYAS